MKSMTARSPFADRSIVRVIALAFLERQTIQKLIFILTPCFLFVSCSQSTLKQIRSGATINHFDVSLWLDKAPKDHSGHRGPPASEPTFEQWIEEGRTNNVNESSLLNLLHNEKTVSRRRAIVSSLSKFGTQQSMPHLLSIIKTDEPLRVDAISCVGFLGYHANAVSLLCEYARNDADINVRANSYITLGRLGGKDAEACIKTGENDKDQFVRETAREAIKLLHSKNK